MVWSAVKLVLLWLSLHAAAAAYKHFWGCKRLGVGICSVSVKSRAFNRLFHRVGRHRHALLRQWFGTGVLVAAMLGASAVFLLLQELLRTIFWVKDAMTANIADPDAPTAAGLPLVEGQTSQGWVMSLAVPGLTVPWTHSIYLWLATAISIGVHEAGHALAAASEGVGVQHIAAFTLLLLPGAYVALDTGTLTVLGPWRTLRVVCAGVWHNAVLCAACWVLALMLPVLLLPVYGTGHGATVRYVNPQGPLAGHLRAGARILSANNCPIASSPEWVSCLARMPQFSLGRAAHQGASSVPERSLTGALTAEAIMDLMSDIHNPAANGFCIPAGLQDGSPPCAALSSADQCGGNDLCFVASSPAQDGWDSGLPRRLAASAAQERSGRCLNARAAASHLPCARGDSSLNRGCPTGTACLAPLLPDGDQFFKLCYAPPLGAVSGPAEGAAGGRRRLPETPDQSSSTRALLAAAPRSSPAAAHRRHHLEDRGGDVAQQAAPQAVDEACTHYIVFVGTPGRLLQSLDVSNYRPKTRLAPLGLPHALEQLLAYTFAVSAGLALINMAPIWFLDGEAAVGAALDLGCQAEGGGFAAPAAGRMMRRRDHLRRAILTIGSLVLAAVLTLHVLKVFGYDEPLRRLLHTLGKLLSFLVTQTT